MMMSDEVRMKAEAILRKALSNEPVTDDDRRFVEETPFFREWLSFRIGQSVSIANDIDCFLAKYQMDDGLAAVVKAMRKYLAHKPASLEEILLDATEAIQELSGTNASECVDLLNAIHVATVASEVGERFEFAFEEARNRPLSETLATARREIVRLGDECDSNLSRLFFSVGRVLLATGHACESGQRSNPVSDRRMRKKVQALADAFSRLDAEIEGILRTAGPDVEQN